MQGESNEHESACRKIADRFPERWLRLYVFAKLRSDPVFPAAYQLLRETSQPVTDLGCGVGLLAFYLRERNCHMPITGVDCDKRKIERAREIARRNYEGVSFRKTQARRSVPREGHIAVFDLLHYLSPNDQSDLLDQLASRLSPGCLLLIRDCPRDAGPRYWLTHLAERLAQVTTWNLKTPLYFPSRDEIGSVFNEEHFAHATRSLWGRTPFNNHLFVFRRRGGVTAPAPEGRSDNLHSLGDAKSVRGSGGETPGPRDGALHGEGESHRDTPA